MLGSPQCHSRVTPGSPQGPCLSPPHAATYVKVYLLENGVCLAKKKTKVVKKTCDPSYQQPLLFEESPQGKVLQVGRDPFPFQRPLPPPETTSPSRDPFPHPSWL